MVLMATAPFFLYSSLWFLQTTNRQVFIVTWAHPLDNEYYCNRTSINDLISVVL